MKKKALITGGTAFVSRYAAEYYLRKGWEVYVLNRNTRPQPEGAGLVVSPGNDVQPRGPTYGRGAGGNEGSAQPGA